MDVKGVLFDLDGVLLKSMEQHLEAWQYAFKDCGVKVEADDFYQLEGRGVKSVVDDLSAKFGIDPAIKPQLIEKKINYYKKIFKVEFYEGLFSLLAYLKNHNIKMAIVTGGDRDRVVALSQKYFDGFFSAIVTADDVTNTKPYPEPYLKGADLLGLEPKECLVIENAPLGIQAAKAAGINVIGVQTTVGAEKLRDCDIPAKDMNEVHTTVVAIVENSFHH